jgi:hypothetical protein
MNRYCENCYTRKHPKLAANSALNPKTEIGEHTRPRVSLDVPRVQPDRACCGTVASALFHAASQIEASGPREAEAA